MSALFICTECGSEARVVRVGQELDGTAKAVRCIRCGAAMSEAGPWGSPAHLLRARAAANRADRATAAGALPPSPSKTIEVPKMSPTAPVRRARPKRPRRAGSRIPRKRRVVKKEKPDA